MTDRRDEAQTLIAGLRDGDVVAMTAFMSRFRPALERLADAHIAPGLRRRFGGESVAQSVCRTFLRRVQGGEFEIVDGDRLWALLCAIALTKVRERVRFHRRHKRALDREAAGDGEELARLTADRSPGPDEIAAFADAFTQVMNACDDEERQLLQLRLEGREVREIADELGCTRRTVSRLLKRVETRLLEAFAD